MVDKRLICKGRGCFDRVRDRGLCGRCLAEEFRKAEAKKKVKR